MKHSPNAEPEDGTRAYDAAVAWLRKCELPDTATPDDGFPQEIYQLELAFDKLPKIKLEERDLIIKKATLARMVVLRYKSAEKLSWSPAACARLFMVYQHFRAIDAMVLGAHSLHRASEIAESKTRGQGVAPHAVALSAYEKRRADFPGESKATARAAVLADLVKTYPGQKMRGVEDATREGSAGRPRR